ncbi:MAG: TetR/AcrR family transcriptional regulator [Jatrophihabitans sp.]|uniref:TetR/AcrR family transcriptional regulator n=1 Tax=Jatrophihabitans sp. TaxID=1932789 RepID=UPI003F7F4DBA
MSASASVDRRTELLTIAAELFAERGLKATTVRDIADAAGILSGSLYHHFDSKESMVDEILREFLDALFGTYREIVDRDLDPRATFEAIVRASFEALDAHHSAVAIYQAEARHLADSPNFAYITERLVEFRTLWHDVLQAGVDDGTFRDDLDVDLAYRFFRDTVWVGVGWYRPGGKLAISDIADQYLAIVLDGITTGRRPTDHTKGSTRG